MGPWANKQPYISDDLIGASFVGFFATLVLVAFHKMPDVNEALHFYKENDQGMFIAMRTCHVVISTAMVMNTRYILGWIMQFVKYALVRHFALVRV